MVGCVTPRYSSTKLNRRVVLTKQTRRNIVCAHVKVPADLFQDRPQGPDGKDFVYRHTDMMLAAHKSGQPRVTARLPGCFVAQFSQRFRQVRAREVTRDLHTAMTSSRTKCRRIILGRAASSKWQTTAARTIQFNSSSGRAVVKIALRSASAADPPSGGSFTRKMISFMRNLRPSSGTNQSLAKACATYSASESSPDRKSVV